MMRFSPELDPDAADAIQVLESVVVEAETKEKETDEKFRDLTEVRGEVKRSKKPVVKKYRETKKWGQTGDGNFYSFFKAFLASCKNTCATAPGAHLLIWQLKSMLIVTP